MAPRAGFIVKNAVDVGTNLDIAEPDALDYNLLGNGRFGVISGCDITVSGSSTVVTVSQGVYVVNDVLALGGGQVTLPSTAQSPRFDLIVGDSGGHVSAILGTANDNPVFPEFPSTVTVFAAVMMRPGVTVLQQSDITDKRIILPTRFTTALTSGSLLHNGDPGNALAPLFDIDYNGKHQWDGDAFLERTSTQTLQVTVNLNVVGTMHAHDVTTDGNVTALGDVVSDNLKTGNGPPVSPGSPADIYRDLTSGAVWIYQGGAWAQLSTVPIPVGFVMPGFITSPPQGWLLVDGSRVARTAYQALWNAMPAWRTTINSVDYVQLPNATDCFFGWGQPGIKSGNTSGSVTLTQANLPPHTHLTSPSGQMNPAGSHNHSASETAAGNHAHNIASSGAHDHPINDPGHLHIPQYNQGGFVCAVWQGHNKLDGYFNDASHTYTVEPLPYTNFATTDISVGFAGNHSHSTDTQGSHQHSLTINADGTNHTHVINEVSVGQGTPIDIRPPFMGMYLYVKT